MKILKWAVLNDIRDFLLMKLLVLRLGVCAGKHPKAIHRDCPRHNEQQGWIPFSEYIAKPDYPRRVEHSGNGEPCTKETAGDEKTEKLWLLS